jgi:hypothetical protein
VVDGVGEVLNVSLPEMARLPLEEGEGAPEALRVSFSEAAREPLKEGEGTEEALTVTLPEAARVRNGPAEIPFILMFLFPKSTANYLRLASRAAFATPITL